MVGIIVISAIIVGLLLVCNRIANAMADGEYGTGDHHIRISYYRGKPLVNSSIDVGEIHEWHAGALTDRSVRSIEITYANGKRERTTKE